MSVRPLQERASGPLAAELLRLQRQKLFERGQIHVTDEAKAFDVSEDTIRRDIRQLGRQGRRLDRPGADIDGARAASVDPENAARCLKSPPFAVCGVLDAVANPRRAE